MGQTYELTTDDLLLREWVEADWRAVHAYASDPAVVRYEAWGPNTEAQTRAFVARAIAAQQEQLLAPVRWQPPLRNLGEDGQGRSCLSPADLLRPLGIPKLDGGFGLACTAQMVSRRRVFAAFGSHLGSLPVQIFLRFHRQLDVDHLAQRWKQGHAALLVLLYQPPVDQPL